METAHATRTPIPLGAKVIALGVLLYVMVPLAASHLMAAIGPTGFLLVALMHPAALGLIVLGAILWAKGEGPGSPAARWRSRARGLSPTSMRAYVALLGAALVAVALLFVVNVFVPLGTRFLSNVGTTVWRLVFGWVWGLLAIVMWSWAPLRPAAAVGLVTAFLVVVAGSLAAWDLVAYDLDQVWVAALVLQLFMMSGTAAWHIAHRDPRSVPAWTCIAATVAAGLAVATSIAVNDTSAALDPRVARSAAPAGIAMAVASVVLLVPGRVGFEVAKWTSFAAPTVLAACAVVAPWLEGGDITAPRGRVWLAGWVVAVVTLLMGGTAWLLARIGKVRETGPRAAATPSGTGRP